MFYTEYLSSWVAMINAITKEHRVSQKNVKNSFEQAHIPVLQQHTASQQVTQNVVQEVQPWASIPMNDSTHSCQELLAFCFLQTGDSKRIRDSSRVFAQEPHRNMAASANNNAADLSIAFSSHAQMHDSFGRKAGALPL